MNLMNKALLAASLALLQGCASFQALNQPGPANLAGIGPGSPRQQLLTQLGTPALTDLTASGHKQDVFKFRSGFSQAGKARVVLYLAADVFTFFISELVLWPLERSLLDAATCTGIATYNINLVVDTWELTDTKSGFQGC